MKERVKGETTEPKAVMALYERVGPTKAAKQLGISTTTLYKARTAKRISRVYEVAAEGLLKEDTPVHTNGRTKEPELLLLEVPREKADLIRRVVTHFGASEVQ